MIKELPVSFTIDVTLVTNLLIIVATAIVILSIGRFVPKLIYFVLDSFISPEVRDTVQSLIKAYRKSISIVIALIIIEIIVLLIPLINNYPIIEILISLTLTITTSWVASRICGEFLDNYLLDIAAKSGRKANSELFISAKVVANLLILVIAIIIFAQTHQINVFGLLASLGIGGLAVAFAAQKTLEQFLGGVVLYLDQPFTIDDYIGLPDDIFGRVESIGWRSTKIRTSGKGTIMIIPNNALTQMNIENYSGAKKVMSILNLNFDREVEKKEQALIRQVILASTSDIFGLDSRSTDITFKLIGDEKEKQHSQAQITFFILGSGEVSMELRRQLLDIAKENVNYKLNEYGIGFDMNEPTIYVDAPITI
ncbi:MAG: mechanosensitive ion channel [Nostocaceae cyanobacterium]|nr:mechanosensitive ion channel [Nostocaceae cyanobacterium]